MRSILSLLICILSVACSQVPPKIVSAPSPQLLPSPPNQWFIKAKLGIRNGEERGSVTLNWKQQNDNYTIRVQGSLGQGNATINGNREHIVIERPGKVPLYSTNANNLIKDTFGWNLPIDHFSYWVRGIANPEQPVESADYGPSGVLVELEQSQWKLNYSRYQAIEQWQLPGRIRAKQVNSQLTLIIREWQLR